MEQPPPAADTANATFSQVLVFVAQAGFDEDVAPASGVCRATWDDARLWERLVRVRTYHFALRHRYPHHPASALHSAAVARGNDGTRVRWLLARGAPVAGGVTPFGMTQYYPIHAAAAAGATAAAMALLDAGANLQAANHEGRTPLMLALRAGNAELALELLRRGAADSASDDQGYTVLHTAALYGVVPVVRALLERGLPPDTPHGRRGGTALHTACMAEEPAAALALLEGGASLTCVDCATWTPLHAAAHRGLTQVVAALLDRGAPIEAPNNLRQTPLHSALAAERAEAALLLIARGADVHARDNGGYTPLHTAIKHGTRGCAAALVRRGADPDAFNGSGLTPLAHAFHLCDRKELGEDLALELVAAGADPNGKPPPARASISGFLPLGDAAGRGWRRAVRALLAAGANVNAASPNDRWTALLRALAHRREDIAVELLRAGADPNARGGKGDRSPLEVALEGGLARAAEALLEAGAGT